MECKIIAENALLRQRISQHTAIFMSGSVHYNFQEFEGTKELVLSVEDEVGIRTIIDELLDALKNQNPGIRKVCIYYINSILILLEF